LYSFSSLFLSFSHSYFEPFILWKGVDKREK
jgi:hypothetical protein